MQTDAKQDPAPQDLPTTAFLEKVLTEIESNSPLNLVPVTDAFRQVFVTRVSFIEIGVVYPSYRSIKAIHQQPSNEKELIEEQKQWLTYWTVYGATLLFEHVLRPLLRKPQSKLNTTAQKQQTTKWKQSDQQRFVKMDDNSSGPSDIVYRNDLSPEEIWRRNPRERESEVQPYRLNHAT
ncbi:11296_t:CDS:2 [Racocetra fulgida]|uniref:11296_t:CDS:1 n=1 Tax=Racocetra fulgida TaxID=60492 RepID=A0A9N9HEK7_9GLOM|nr:11296_t:CDS:2 [Racocetra fulgida]